MTTVHRFIALISVVLIASTAGAEVTGSHSVRIPVERLGPRSPMMLSNPRHTGISYFDGPRRGVVVWRAMVQGGLVGAPAADANGRTIFATDRGSLHLLDVDGREIFRVKLTAPSSSTPALMSDGSVIAAARDGVVTAFTSDLEPIWSVRVGKELLSSPAINTREHSLAISAKDTTVVLDTRTGEVLFRWSAGNGYNNSSPTLGPDGVWRITNWGGFAVAIGPAGQELWRTHLGDKGFWSSPTLGPNGELFTAGTRDRAAVGLSPEGRLLWRTQLGWPVHKFLTQNLSGQVFIPNQPVLEFLDPRSGESQPSVPLDATEMVYTSIAVSQDGVAYFGTSSRKLRAMDGRHVLWTVPTVAPMEAPPVLIGTHRGRPRLVAADAGGNVICVE